MSCGAPDACRGSRRPDVISRDEWARAFAALRCAPGPFLPDPSSCSTPVRVKPPWGNALFGTMGFMVPLFSPFFVCLSPTYAQPPFPAGTAFFCHLGGSWTREGKKRGRLDPTPPTSGLGCSKVTPLYNFLGRGVYLYLDMGYPTTFLFFGCPIILRFASPGRGYFDLVHVFL